MNKATTIRLTVLLSIILLFIIASYAAVPHLINYQGRLTDSGGNPLNGSYALTFRIYDAEAAGNLLWEETQTVTIQKGIFSVLLGGVTSLNLPFDKPYFLEIKVGGEVMSPRQRITSAGYAIRAEKAEMAESAIKAEGVSGITNIFPSSGNVGIGTTGPNGKLGVSGNIRLEGSDDRIQFYNPAEIIKFDAPTLGPAPGMLFTAHATRCFMFGTYDGTTYSGTRMIINTAGNVGIGTTSPTQKLDIQGGPVKIEGIVIDHVTGSNPGCSSGGMVIRKWVSKFCYGGCGTNCTTGAGWSTSIPTCQYSGCYEPGLTCTADSWTEAVCMGN